MIFVIRRMVLQLKKTATTAISRSHNPYVLYVFVFLMGWRNRYIHHSWFLSKLHRQLYAFRGYGSFMLTGTGVLILFYDEKVIKIPLSRTAHAALEGNFKAFKKLKKTGMSCYVNYRIERIHGCLEMDYLAKANLSVSDVQAIADDLATLARLAPMSRSAAEAKCAVGIKILSRFSGNPIGLPESLSLQVSAMHGDLTENNIMMDAFGHVALIDLDRFDFSGIYGLDFVHYKVTHESYTRSRDFPDCLYEFSKFHPAGFLIVYLLYRITVEHSDEVVLPDRYYRDALRVYNFLLLQCN